MMVDHIVLSENSAILKRISSDDGGELWRRNVSSLLRMADVEPGSCGFVDSLPDESQLLTDCLSDAFVTLEGSDEGPATDDCPSVLTIIEKKSGVALYKTCVESSSVIDLKGSGNRVVLVYRSARDQRLEILLLESFITADEDMAIQQYVGILPISDVDKISFTHTRNHITPQSLILHAALEGKFYEVPLESISYMRRAASPPTSPIAPARAVSFAMRQGKLNQVPGSNLSCVPTERESTTICQLDDFDSFELAPVNKFDALPESFSQFQCAGVVLSMMILLATLLYKIRRATPKLI